MSERKLILIKQIVLRKGDILDKQDKDILKLSKLCKHWADHNDSHKDNFLKWRNIAKEKGLQSVVENLGKAVEMLDKCNDYLLKAYRDIEQKIIEIN